MKLYKVLYIDDLMTPNDVFDEIDILDEKGLRYWFKDRILSDGFCDDTLEEFGLDVNTNENQMSVELILKIFKYDGFRVETLEIKND